MSNISVSIGTPNISVSLATGAQGPAGPTGPAGGTAVTYTAGEALAAGRVVIIDDDEAFYFQPTLSAHLGRAYGITVSAASIGADTTIQIGGEMTNAAFTFTADRQVFVNANGVIVDSAPATLVIQSAGAAAADGTLRIDFSLSVLTS